MASRSGVLLCLLGLVLVTWGCNPPTLYETRAGFQPRSQTYTVLRLEGHHNEPMPEPWRLIERRNLHLAIESVATADHYDMVFFERIGEGFGGGAGVYLWTDLPTPRRGSASVEDRGKQYLDQFGKASLARLQPGAPDYGCPCALHSVQEKSFEFEGVAGFEAMGFQQVEGQGGPDLGFYLAVMRRMGPGKGEDMHVVVLHVSPVERFNKAVNDVRGLRQRLRWNS